MPCVTYSTSANCFTVIAKIFIVADQSSIATCCDRIMTSDDVMRHRCFRYFCLIPIRTTRNQAKMSRQINLFPTVHKSPLPAKIPISNFNGATAPFGVGESLGRGNRKHLFSSRSALPPSLLVPFPRRRVHVRSRRRGVASPTVHIFAIAAPSYTFCSRNIGGAKGATE